MNSLTALRQAMNNRLSILKIALEDYAATVELLLREYENLLQIQQKVIKSEGKSNEAKSPKNKEK